MENKLIIIDSNALLHRAFHALPPLATKNGEETGAIYGYLLILFKAIADLKANYVVACFDTKAPTFRHEMYKEYKGTRATTPDQVILQLPKTKLVLDKLKIPVFAKEGVEADDLIATISQISLKQKNDLQVFILSGDLDNLQLVNEKVFVYTLGKGIKDTVIYDEEKVMSRFGIRPDQVVDYKALIGDKSDNIPGVKGIGKTTASDILQRYNNISNLYSELSTDTAVVKPKVKELLKQGKENAFLSYKLAEMKKDVDINFDIVKCKFGDFDIKEVSDIFHQFEFNTLINRLTFLKKYE